MMITFGTVRAGNLDYAIIEYGCIDVYTFDGFWTDPLEWHDGPVLTMDDTALSVYTIDFGTYAVNWLIEIFDDNTTDAEDYWQICLDPDNSGGTAPGSGDYKIEIVGHTDLVCYQGSGSDWTEITPDPGEVMWSNSISGMSPWNLTEHWVLELYFIKTAGVIQTPAPPNGMRVAVYDASNPDAGHLCWPPESDADVPDTWGEENYQMANIPESLSFGVVVLLSSVAVLVGSSWLRKRSRIGKSNERD